MFSWPTDTCWTALAAPSVTLPLLYLQCCSDHKLIRLQIQVDTSHPSSVIWVLTQAQIQPQEGAITYIHCFLWVNSIVLTYNEAVSLNLGGEMSVAAIHSGTALLSRSLHQSSPPASSLLFQVCTHFTFIWFPVWEMQLHSSPCRGGCRVCTSNHHPQIPPEMMPYCFLMRLSWSVCLNSAAFVMFMVLLGRKITAPALMCLFLHRIVFFQNKAHTWENL